MGFENELMWGDRRIRIASLSGYSASVDRSRPLALPAALVSLAERAERGGCANDEDLAVACSDAMAHKLTNRMWQRAHELASQARLASPLPDDVTRLGRELSPQAVVEVIGAVVGTHLEYDTVAAARHASGSTLALVLEVAKAAWKLRGRRSARIARQVTSRGIAKGVCLDYATAMRTLFYALKRATGAPSDAFVVEVAGEAFRPTDDMHVWNWLIDGKGASIVAFDATQTRGRRGGLAINLARYHNVSAFLATAVAGATRCNGLDPGHVADLLAASIDPETDRGQTLLFGIADHLGTTLDIRDRLAAHLAARNFERLLPDWRARLARRTAVLGSVGRKLFARSQRDMLPLAQLGLATAEPPFP